MIDEEIKDDDGNGNEDIDEFDDVDIDDKPVGDGIDEDDDKYRSYDQNDEIIFDSNDSHDEIDDDANMYFHLDLLQKHSIPEIQEGQTLDTKTIREGKSASSVLDPFGTGELFDESSAAASVAMLGFLMVMIVGACLYASFRQTMAVTPTYQNGGKKNKASLPSFSKRRE